MIAVSSQAVRCIDTNMIATYIMCNSTDKNAVEAELMFQKHTVKPARKKFR